MSLPLHPAAVLFQGAKPFPALAACEHFAGPEKTIRKALQMRSELQGNDRPPIDIAADCEDDVPLPPAQACLQKPATNSFTPPQTKHIPTDSN